MARVAFKPRTLTQRVEERVARKKGDVFMREDFRDLGGYRQIGRSLRELTRSGKLLRIGQGLYARAEPSILDGRPVPVKGIRIFSEALGRVGVKTGPSSLLRAYNEGRTTQVPTGRVIRVDRRVRRKLGYGGMTVSFERV